MEKAILDQDGLFFVPRIDVTGFPEHGGRNENRMKKLTKERASDKRSAGRKQFTAISTFEVRNNMEEVRQAFLDRPGFVEAADGFVGLDVLRPLDNPSEFWLITHWESREAFEHWHRHHKSESHQGIPKGLKLVKRSFELRHFEHVTE